MTPHPFRTLARIPTSLRAMGRRLQTVSQHLIDHLFRSAKPARRMFIFATNLPLGAGVCLLMLCGLSAPVFAQMPVSGQPVPSLAQLDTIMQQYMAQYHSPGANLSLSVDGKLVFARGYGYANTSTGEFVQPDSRMRLASNSKVITAVGILKLIEQGKLSLSTTPFASILGDLQPPAGTTKDPRINNITIQNLLEHKAGYDDGNGYPFDPVNDYTTITAAASAAGMSGQATTPVELISYELGVALQHDPGTTYAYSNLGYLTLGYIIERVTGVPYATWLEQNVFPIAKMTQTLPAGNLLSQKLPYEVSYYGYPGEPLGPSLIPPVGTQVLYEYGAIDLSLELANGGWTSTPMDLLRLWDTLNGQYSYNILNGSQSSRVAADVPPLGQGYYYTFYGSLPGTNSLVHLNTSSQVVGRVVYSAIFNTRDGSNLEQPESDADNAIQAFVKTVTAWPTGDLFPTYATSGTACSFTLASATATAPVAGSTATVALADANFCAWSAVSNASWIHVTAGALNSDSGSVGYTVDANTGNARTGTIMIAGQTYSVTQAGTTTVTPTAPQVAVIVSQEFAYTTQSISVGLSVYGTFKVPNPTGTIQATIGGYSFPLVTVDSSGATSPLLQLPAGSLPPGSYTISATYTPDAASAVNYTSATGSIPLVISAPLPDNTGWTWEAGSTLDGAYTAYNPKIPYNGSPAIYGTLRVPAKGNTPGGRFYAQSWVDAKGNIWLFGGEGPDATGQFGYENDLWKLDPTTQQWAWMSGSSTVTCTPGIFLTNCGVAGTYGTLGTPALANTPSGRANAMTWTDNNGDLWLFGGATEVGGLSNSPTFSDLWKFSTSTLQWTWEGGDSAPSSCSIAQATCTSQAVYGSLGIAAKSNTPGNRSNASAWKDSSGNFWLFGGINIVPDPNYAGASSLVNDFWKFDPVALQWTWEGGNTTYVPSTCSQGICGDPGVYGSLGVAAATNLPGGRYSPVTWTDTNGNFWLFGGIGLDDKGTRSILNDLWEFSPSTAQWTWVSGSNDASGYYPPKGVYGTKGVAAASNVPDTTAFGAGWADKNGNLWLFGGYGYDPTSASGWHDALWQFNIATGQWTWQGGTAVLPVCTSTSICGYAGVYGTLGTSAAGDYPGSREGAISWLDNAGNLVLFGGQGFDANGTLGSLNDQWQYHPSPAANVTPVTATPVFSVNGGTYGIAQTVNITDATPGANIYYTTNGSTPTTSSTPYSTSIAVTSSETLEAIAIASGSSVSAVATATYVITPPAKITPTVTVTPITVTLTSAQALSTTVTVSGGVGNAVPTGTITLSATGYTSAVISLSAGVLTYSIPAGSLPVGIDSLTATYTPDSAASATYSSAIGSAVVTVTAAPVTFTVGTAPAGLAFSVDGTVYTTAQTLSWTPGSTHTLSVASPQTSAGTQSTFTSWSDGGAASHTVTATSASTTYTASFSTAYQLTTAGNPSVGGIVSPASGTYYLAGTVIPLTATPTSGYTFSNWTGGVAAPSSSTTSVTVNAPVTITANFAAITPPSATLTPSTLAFSSVSGVTSATQTATLTNIGTAALSITGITLTGNNPTVFAFTTTCGNTLATAAACSITLSFTPSSVAAFSASLSIADNANGSPQTITLTGTGTPLPSFTLSANPATPTTTYGGTVQSSIVATAQNGAFPGQIALTVSGLPTSATASFAPASLTPGSASATSVLTIQVPSTLAKAKDQPFRWPLAVPSLAMIGLLLLPRKLRRRRLAAIALAFAAAVGIGGLTGCTGGFNVTTPRTFNVTVTGTSGSLQQTTTVQVTVQ